MAYQDDIALMAHLMRRAGFGAGRDELEARVAKGYEATVEELLHPETQPAVDMYTLLRYQPASLLPGGQPPMGNVNIMYHLVNTKRPLEEKMALFWHHVFATGNSKVDNYDQLLEQIGLFRQQGMGNYRELLLTIARNPTMIFWLDNNQNHGTAVNENWGRELLELFSMGVGAYTEKDVREASRAFTGWTFETKIPRLPYGRFPWKFEYRPEDHDDGEKEFLGHRGRFNGEDIIDIVVEQPACARFVCRHLYNFFVADEAQVPAWSIEPPRDQKAIDTMTAAFRQSRFDIRSVLRVLFNSSFFKEARFKHLKSPAEVVVGSLRFVGGYELPRPGYGDLSMQPAYMGQDLLNPPSVEGWHTGPEWINSGSLMARINFVAGLVGDPSLPGVRAIIDRLKAKGTLSPEQLVDGCLDLLGPVEVSPETRQELTAQAKEWGETGWASEKSAKTADKRVGEMLQLIVATREYQFA
ncbi:MAG: hypothetical protein DME00_32485 [Candidatus Rokuibacteriota bacterium]|nr:MAG: hypothetical protein DME00_32485 [Candidatus Rokubacteria bacterium]PYO10599.1 MAG: hypothetical protein DMD75_13050 [Candidatus Rokubacteria bacterium]